MELETPLWTAGSRRIAGLDEAGAGPLAGPIFAACVVVDPERAGFLLGVDDSKALTATARAERAEVIRTHALAFAVSSASVEEIDRINILQAGLLAMRRALDEVCAKLGAVDHVFIDARKLGSRFPETSIIKGDAKSLSIAAASILAKVARDAVMCEAAVSYPQYGFERHKGYATEDHLAAVRAHGPTPLHRRTFAPISTMLSQPSLFDTTPYERRNPRGGP